MAYPFFQAPTFAEFKEKLERLGCRFKQMTVEGYPGPISYFERRVGDEDIQCVLEAQQDETRVAPSVIRSVCTRLKVNPAEFGLHLG